MTTRRAQHVAFVRYRYLYGRLKQTLPHTGMALNIHPGLTCHDKIYEITLHQKLQHLEYFESFDFH